MMSDHDTHAASLKYHDKFDDGTICMEPKHNNIVLLVLDLTVSRNTLGWAEVEDEMGLEGGYMPSIYSPVPDPPSPTPWYPDLCSALPSIYPR
jgi:hypothetical protein